MIKEGWKRQDNFMSERSGSDKGLPTRSQDIHSHSVEFTQGTHTDNKPATENRDLRHTCVFMGARWTINMPSKSVGVGEMWTRQGTGLA